MACTAFISAINSITRCAAISKPLLSKICEPIWQWKPRISICFDSNAFFVATAAAPLEIENPNFTSSCAVEINS